MTCCTDLTEEQGGAHNISAPVLVRSQILSSLELYPIRKKLAFKIGADLRGLYGQIEEVRLNFYLPMQTSPRGAIAHIMLLSRNIQIQNVLTVLACVDSLSHVT